MNAKASVILRKSTFLTALLPSAWIFLLGLLVLRVRWASGGLPPQKLAKFYPFQIHFTITQLFFLGFPFLALGALVQIWLLRRQDPRFRAIDPALVTVLSVIASSLVIALDPGGYFSWFCD